jgi:hypothetical protein
MPDGVVRVAKDHRSAHSVMLLARFALARRPSVRAGHRRGGHSGYERETRVMMRLNGSLIQ